MFKVNNSENGTRVFPETSVMDYHCTLGNIPEDRRPQDSRSNSFSELCDIVRNKIE